MTDNHGYKDSAFGAGMAFASWLASRTRSISWGPAANLAMKRRSD